MTTLNYEGVDYNVVYIDPSSETNGDGTTYSTAMNAFPSSYTDKTVYLFRRTDETSKISMPKSGNAGLKYIMFLGMPREGQQFYDLLDDDGVKEAWKDESAKYANLLMNSSSYSSSHDANSVIYYETSNVMFIANNCYFFRDNDSGSSQSYCNYMFHISTGIQKFLSCKFGYTQYNLDDDNYLENNTNIDTNTSKYPQNKCRNFLILDGIYFVMDDCIINIVNSSNSGSQPYGNYSNYSAIYVGNSKSYINNCSIYYYCYVTSESYGDKLFFTSPNYKIKDVNITLINPQNYVTVIRNNAYNFEYSLKNIHIHTKKFKNYEFSDDSYPSSYVIMIRTRYGNNQQWINSMISNAQIDGIYYDYSNEPVKLPYLNVCDLGIPYYENGAPKSYVKNIDLKFNPEYSTYHNTIVSIRGVEYNYNSSSSSTAATYGGYSSNIGKSFICDNIKIDSIGSSYALYLEGVGVKSDEIRGHVSLNHSTLDVNKIYNDRGSQAGIYSQGNSFLRCKEYEANTNNKDYLYSGQRQVALRYTSDSTTYDYYSDPQHIYIDKTNAVLFDEYTHSTSSSAGKYGLYVCPNYIQTGQFYARNESVFAKTWNVVRTGSTSQASIRFNNNQCQSANWLRIGYEPYKGITITPSTTGNKVLTAYIALKNINENDVINCLNDFELEVRVPNLNEDGSICYDYYPSKSFGWMKDDSTWSNDSDLNTFKIEIPVEVKDVTNPIEIGFAYRHYDTLGVLYFDPDVKIADKN